MQQLMTDKKELPAAETDKPEHIPYSVGRQYVMDWRASIPSPDLPRSSGGMSAERILHPPAQAEERPSVIETQGEVVHSPRIAESEYIRKGYYRRSEDMYVGDRSVGDMHVGDTHVGDTHSDEDATTEDKDNPLSEQTTASPRITEGEYARKSYRPAKDHRLAVQLILCAVGIAAGAVIALMFPLEGTDLSAASQGGDFLSLVLHRMAQCGVFLLVEYVLGYFAAGGWLVWLVPLVYGLGAGLSCAGIAAGGQDLWLILPPLAFCGVICCGAAASGSFSALLMRLVSGRGEMYAAGGSSSYQYTLKFGGYLLALLAAALIEAGMKLM